MIAAVGGTRKVIGNNIATPFTEPRPGIAPTNNPMVQPSRIIPKFNGSSASNIPALSNVSIESTMFTFNLVIF